LIPITKILPKNCWLSRWLQCWPHLETPRSYLAFVGLQMVGIGVHRRVWFDRGIHKVFPLLNLILLGPSGIGKTTAIDAGLELVENTFTDPGAAPQILKDETTPEGLHSALSRNSWALVVAPELATMFNKQKYMEKMIPYVTNLLDYKDTVDRYLVSQGQVRVHTPSVSVLGGSTIEWLQDAVPDSALKGGFLPRFLMLHERSRWQKIAHPMEALGRAERERLERYQAQVYREFEDIVRNAPEGPRGWLDYSVADVYGRWYDAYASPTEALEPFAARASMWVTRLALLMSLCRQATAIDEEDLRTAIALFEYVENRLAEALQFYTPRGRLLKAVLDSTPYEAISCQVLFRRLKHLATAREVRELLESLRESGDVEALTENRVRRVR
jgi:hypothetical protein